VQPVSTDRIKWYRAYDPTAFEGIYALSDILSVRHKMKAVFAKGASVQLPIDHTIAKEYETKAFKIEDGNYKIIKTKTDSTQNGQVTIPYIVRNSTRWAIQ